MIIVYTNTCAPCKYRIQMAAVKRLAKSLGTLVEIKETKGNKSLQDEARLLSDIELPFVYNTDTRSSVALQDARIGFTL